MVETGGLLVDMFLCASTLKVYSFYNSMKWTKPLPSKWENVLYTRGSIGIVHVD